MNEFTLASEPLIFDADGKPVRGTSLTAFRGYPKRVVLTDDLGRVLPPADQRQQVVVGEMIRVRLPRMYDPIRIIDPEPDPPRPWWRFW